MTMGEYANEMELAARRSHQLAGEAGAMDRYGLKVRVFRRRDLVHVDGGCQRHGNLGDSAQGAGIRIGARRRAARAGRVLILSRDYGFLVLLSWRRWRLTLLAVRAAGALRFGLFRAVGRRRGPLRERCESRRRVRIGEQIRRHAQPGQHTHAVSRHDLHLPQLYPAAGNDATANGDGMRKRAGDACAKRESGARRASPWRGAPYPS